MKEIKDMYKSLMRRLGSSAAREHFEGPTSPQDCLGSVAGSGRSGVFASGSPLPSVRSPSSKDGKVFHLVPSSPESLVGNSSAHGSGSTVALPTSPSTQTLNKHGVHGSQPTFSPPASPAQPAIAHTFSSTAPTGTMHPAQQQQPQQQQQQQQSTTLAISHHCPTALRRTNWCVTDFDLRALMYNGNISMVYHAVDRRSGITIALKLYKRVKLTAIERHQVAREIKLHINLCHDSIIAMYAAWKDRNYVYMALEWAPGGDVYGYLRANHGRLGEEVAVPLIMEPFLSGLSIIHERGLIHRDIKPENILLNNSFQIKIADFGLSIDSKNEVANTRLGTIDYLAPEILDCPVKQNPNDNKENPNIGYTNKVDCWSVGVLAYELLAGQPPFAAPSPQETLRLIRTKEVEYPPWFSLEAVDFMRKVLVRDPLRRPTIAQVLDHPWIRRYSRRDRAPAGGASDGTNGSRIVRRNSMPMAMLMSRVQPVQTAHPAAPASSAAHPAAVGKSAATEIGNDSSSEADSVTAVISLARPHAAAPQAASPAKNAASAKEMHVGQLVTPSKASPKQAKQHGNYTEQSYLQPLPEPAAAAAAAAAAAQASHLATRTQKFLSVQPGPSQASSSPGYATPSPTGSPVGHGLHGVTAAGQHAAAGAAAPGAHIASPKASNNSPLRGARVTHAGSVTPQPLIGQAPSGILSSRKRAAASPSMSKLGAPPLATPDADMVLHGHGSMQGGSRSPASSSNGSPRQQQLLLPPIV
ncbi:kinase-like domain-containing protein [Haematococcus lacustris]